MYILNLVLKSKTATLITIVVIICNQVHLTLFFLRGLGVQWSTSLRLIAGAEQHQKFLEKLECDRRDRLELL
jgi:hypothetical protein